VFDTDTFACPYQRPSSFFVTLNSSPWPRPWPALVRAERDRLGLRAGDSPSSSSNAPPESSQAGAASKVQDAKVLVTKKGYEPATVAVRAGEPARITFVRTTDKTCGTEVVFPSLNIRRPLPLNEPVAIEFTPKNSGEIAFVCGMNMLRGTVVVQ
jgi:plastocyanin